MSLVWVLMTVLPNSLPVWGDVSCPTPGAVSQFLSTSVPDERLHVELRKREPGVEVLLRRGARDVMAQHALTEEASCEEHAQAAGALVTAWLMKLEMGHVPEPQWQSGLAENPARATAGNLQPASRWGVRMGGVLSTGHGALVPGASLALTLRPRAGRFLLNVEGAWERSWTSALGPGRVEWKRMWASAGVGYLLLSRPLRLSAHSHVVAARLNIRGLGYTHNRTAEDTDFGVGAGLFLSYGTRPLSPWVGAQATRWLSRQRVWVTGLDEAQVLPPVSLVASFGVALELG